MLLIDLCILICWQIVDPLKRTVEEYSLEVSVHFDVFHILSMTVVYISVPVFSSAGRIPATQILAKMPVCLEFRQTKYVPWAVAQASLYLLFLGRDVSHSCLLCLSHGRTFASLDVRLWQSALEKRHLGSLSHCWRRGMVLKWTLL